MIHTGEASLKKFEIYTSSSGGAKFYYTKDPNAIDVTWNVTTKTGTFTMPGGNVKLTPLYAPTAAWAVVETVEQLPAAAEGLVAGTDASLNVSVRSNKFDLVLKAANANTIDATEASKGTVTVAGTDKTSAIANSQLKAIKMGSEVKLKANTGYKFRKVEVKKAGPLTYATTEGAVTRIKFDYTGSKYADFTYSNGSFARTGGTSTFSFSGSWTMKEENGVLTMTVNYNHTNTQYIYFVCTFNADTNEYTESSTGDWNISFIGIEVNGTDITDQLTKKE